MTSRRLKTRKNQRWCGLGAAALALGMFAVSPGLAAAHGGPAGAQKAVKTCSGTFKSPGVLSGNYHRNVSVTGVCEVNAGPAVVNGNLSIQKGGAVVAAFALNDKTHGGTSSLTVHGSVQVQKGGVMLLGCDPQSSPCIDDDQNNPTLSSPGTIGGNLEEDHALGVIIHDTSIGGNIDQKSGGGGINCNPSGLFAAIKSPVFSAYEDSTVGGNIEISGLRSCWLGLGRLHVGGHLNLAGNKLADPDAIEVLSNTIGGNLSCRHNSALWDSAETGNGLFPRTATPNTVGGHRYGQCVLASRRTAGGPAGPGLF